MDVKSAISGGKTAFELAKSLMNGLAKGQIQADEVPSRLMELQQHILNMQSVVHDLAENRGLRQQLEDQKRQGDLTEDMEFRIDGGFWVRKSESEKGLIPYCPACWGKDQKLVVMAPYSKPGIFRCPLHEKTAYSTSVYTEWLKTQPKQQRSVVRGSWMG